MQAQKLFCSHAKQTAEDLQILQSDKSFLSAFSKACNLCISAFQHGSKILIAGNGGSAADAQHLAGELVSRFYFDRPPLSAIALTTDTSIITAIGNDYGYEDIFSRQVEAHGKIGDIFIAISTSGNSQNILRAINKAKTLGISVIGLTGENGGAMKDLCDVCICAPSNSTPRIQECHLVIEHSLCAIIENTLFGQIKSV